MAKVKRVYKFGQSIGECGAQFLCNSSFKSKNRCRKVWVQCGKCGNPWHVREYDVIKSLAKSCCGTGSNMLLPPEARIINSPIYGTWVNMYHRCENSRHKAFKNYGGRGIDVHESWKEFKNFERDMLPSFEQGLQLDRTNNDKGYSKENCRWVTPKENARNKRSNLHITVNGETKILAEWAEERGILAETISSRINRGVVGEDLFKQTKRGAI